eukprot:365270-Chlamydomonas_euryale.AAC.12
MQHCTRQQRPYQLSSTPSMASKTCAKSAPAPARCCCAWHAECYAVAKLPAMLPDTRIVTPWYARGRHMCAPSRTMRLRSCACAKCVRDPTPWRAHGRRLAHAAMRACGHARAAAPRVGA